MHNGVNAILEGLRSPVNEAAVYGDYLVADNRRKMEDAISDGIVKKLSSKFIKYGQLEVTVDVDLTDNDDIDLVDIVDEIHVNMFFNNPVDGTTPRDVLKVIASLKPFKSMSPKYDTRSDVYYVDITGNEKCSDFIAGLESLGISFKRACRVISASEIENNLETLRREAREERASLERDYNRSRI